MCYEIENAFIVAVLVNKKYLYVQYQSCYRDNGSNLKINKYNLNFHTCLVYSKLHLNLLTVCVTMHQDKVNTANDSLKQQMEMKTDGIMDSEEGKLRLLNNIDQLLKAKRD